jgi:DNA replication and repair protein RecF
MRERGIRKDTELDAWNEKLVNIGIEIIKHRDQFVREFVVYVSESYKRILYEKEIPGMKYYFLEGSSGKDLEKSFVELLDKKAEDEVRRGINLVGPHKDDIIFNINGMNLKSYGSQGQHKTFQTMLRFAEYFYLKDKKENTPLFLLDDVFGELDSERASAISQSLKDVSQAIITLTDFGNISHLNIDKKDRVIKLSSETEISYAQ